MERFNDWEFPKIEDGKLTKWNWMVQGKEGLELGNKTDIGAFTYINAKNGVEIGDFVEIGSHCSIYSESTIDGKKGKIMIGKNAKIGSHSTIMPGINIGENSIIGAHSFVNKDIPTNAIAFGAPVKIIKFKESLEKDIPIEISARHVHLCKKDLQELFGENYELTPWKKLSQSNEFASLETVELNYNGKKIEARVLGPVRDKTQIEISLTDAYSLGFESLPPVKISGDLEDACEIIVEGPRNKINAKGVIIAQRHLHCSEEQAEKLQLKDNDKVRIMVDGKRKIIFEDVVVRVGKNYQLTLHLDTDEGNAAGIKNSDYGILIN